MRHELAVIDGPDIDLVDSMDAWGDDGQTCRCVLSDGPITLAGRMRGRGEKVSWPA
jgi:hypothetical protein